MGELPQEWKYVACCRAFFTCLVLIAAIAVTMELKGTTVYSGDDFLLEPNWECQVIIYPYDRDRNKISLVNYSINSGNSIAALEGQAKVKLKKGGIQTRLGLNTNEECGHLVFDVIATGKRKETRIRNGESEGWLELPEYCGQDKDWEKNWGFREGAFGHVLLVGCVVVWVGLRLQGLLMEYFQLKVRTSDNTCGVSFVKLGIYLIFNLAPTILLRPFTSMELHEDCPHVITMFFNSLVHWFLAAFGFLMLIDTCLLLYLVKENVQGDATADVGVCGAICSIFTFFPATSYAGDFPRPEKKKDTGVLMTLAYFLVPAVPLLMMVFAAIVKIYEAVHIDWTMWFGFRLPIAWLSYDIGYKVSIFSVLMILVTALDLLGMVSQFFKFKRKVQSHS